jgi:hypothetical protein
VELHLNNNVNSDALAPKLARLVPHLKILNVTVAYRRVRHENEADSWDYSPVYLPIHDSYYRLPHIALLQTVYLLGFRVGSSRDGLTTHDTENPSVTTLHVQLTGRYCRNWNSCTNITRLQMCFPNVTALHFCGTKKAFLSGEAFHGLCTMRRRGSLWNLRKLEYSHNEAPILDFWPPISPLPPRYGFHPFRDATSENSLHYLLPFELKTLVIDTGCLLPYIAEDGVVHLNFSDLPVTLQSLDIRHIFFSALISPVGDVEKPELDDVDAMSCLNHVLHELRKFENFTKLTALKLLVFIPRRHVLSCSKIHTIVYAPNLWRG